MRDLEKAKWIWQNRENTPDEYVEFSFCFAMPKNKKAIFNIAADSNYVLTVNGQIAAFGQYADYPDYKVYDSVNISKYLQEDNQVSLLVPSLADSFPCTPRHLGAGASLNTHLLKALGRG